VKGGEALTKLAVSLAVRVVKFGEVLLLPAGRDGGYKPISSE